MLDRAASALSFADWAVVIAIFALTALAAWFGRSRASAASDVEYLLMGRRLTLPLMVATLVATWYGDVLGVTQIAFEKGIYMFVTQGVCWYAAYVAFALLLARRLRRSGALSLYDFVRRRHGPLSAGWIGLLSLITLLPLSCSVGAGALLHVLFGLPLPIAMLAALLLAAACCQIGGFRGVIFSDVVQFVAMCAGVAVVACYSLCHFGGFSFLTERLPEAHLVPTGYAKFQNLLVWFCLAISATFLHPAFYQRCLAAKNERIAQGGILISCLIWAIFDSCTLLGGLYARAVFPEADSVYAYLLYGLELLPMGLKGLFIAGIMATILSTLDSSIFLAGSLLSEELPFLRWRSRRTGRLFSLVIVIGCTLSMPYLFDCRAESIWLTIEGLFSCAALLPVLMGRLLNLTDRGFLLCSTLGGGGMLIWQLVVSLFEIDIHPYFAGHLMSLGSALSLKAVPRLQRLIQSFKAPARSLSSPIPE